MMKITEFIFELKQLNSPVLQHPANTCDNLYYGDGSKELHKVAIGMFATLDSLAQAKEWGADLFITHEPTFQNNAEEVDESSPVHRALKARLLESGMALFRYHDHPHGMADDLIDVGTIRYSGLKGQILEKMYFAVTRFRLDAPMTAADITAAFQKNLCIRHLQMVGTTDKPGRNIAFACGTPGHIMELLKDDSIDFIVTGEICDWAWGEYAREAQLLGINKALLVLGHCNSERYGMKYLTDLLQPMYPALQFTYIDVPDIYTYID